MVGIVRLITYVHAVITSLVTATPQPLYGEDLAQVAVSLGVAVPLFWWSFNEWRRSNLVISGLRPAPPTEGGASGEVSSPGRGSPLRDSPAA